jgi:hypothetical protein
MTEYPKAIEPKLDVQYDWFAKSGGGFFYDEVLEYREWCHPELGAPDKYDGDDYLAAFETFEEAKTFSETTIAAETPLVLVVQHEYIDEPVQNEFFYVKEQRITEWQVSWLAGSKRDINSIVAFLAEKERK